MIAGKRIRIFTESVQLRNDCGGELINYLGDFEPGWSAYLNYDNGYTYGFVSEDMVSRARHDDSED